MTTEAMDTSALPDAEDVGLEAWELAKIDESIQEAEAERAVRASSLEYDMRWERAANRRLRSFCDWAKNERLDRFLKVTVTADGLDTAAAYYDGFPDTPFCRLSFFPGGTRLSFYRWDWHTNPMFKNGPQPPHGLEFFSDYDQPGVFVREEAVFMVKARFYIHSLKEKEKRKKAKCAIA